MAAIRHFRGRCLLPPARSCTGWGFYVEYPVMMNRREFLQLLSIAAAGGMTLSHTASAAEQAAKNFYDLPRFGNVHFLHFTDCHAQLQPVYFREPSVNLGFGNARNRPPHIVGEHL